MRKFIDIVAAAPTTHLNETLTETYPISWTKEPDMWQGRFETEEGKRFTLLCRIDTMYRGDSQVHEFSFVPGDFNWTTALTGGYPQGVTGDIGSPHRIFATAIEGYRQYIKAVEPESVLVLCVKGEGSRLRLYNRVNQRIQTELMAMGYERSEIPDHQFFDRGSFSQMFEPFYYVKK